AEQQAQEHLGDDSASHRTKLRSDNRCWPVAGGNPRARSVPGCFGEDVGPQWTVTGERAFRDLVDGNRLFAALGFVHGLANENFAVREHWESHRLRNRLTRWQSQPPASLQIAQRERWRWIGNDAVWKFAER